MSTTLQIEIDRDAMERGIIGVDEKSQTIGSQSSPTVTHNSQESQPKSIASKVSLSKPFQKWQQYLMSLIPERRNNQENAEDEDLSEPSSGLRRLEYCPTGYPYVAAFLDSDENFMIYRRFGYLQARILLNKQEELKLLEEKLDIFDKRDETNNPRVLNSRDNDEVSGGPRLELLKSIETKFREYAQLLCIAQQMVALSKPASIDYTSVKRWFDTEEPIVEDEFYIQHKEDVITLKPGRENAWLDGFVETVLRKLNCSLMLWIFRSKETRAKTSGQTVIYFTKKRVEFLVTLIITAVILALLVVPVYLLWHLSDGLQTHQTDAITIGVLLIFTLIFSAVLSFFTRAQRHEILGAAAAYCAVLVVFISNVGNNKNGP